MPDLSAPAKPPVPASLGGIKPKLPSTPKLPEISKLPPWIPLWLRKKRYLYIVIGVVVLWIGLAIASAVYRQIQKNNRPKPEFHSVAPAVKPADEPLISTAPNLPQDVTVNPARPGWQRYTNSQGGWWFEHPTLFTLQNSADFYAGWQPTWFEDKYYFDCINRQVGSRLPFPCWLFEIYLSTGSQSSSNPMSEWPGEMGTATTLVDSQNRSWQSLGPVTVGDTWRWYATRAENGVSFVFDTRIVKRNFSNFLQVYPERPFAQEVRGVDDANLQKAYEQLLQQVLGTFTSLRKPLVDQPNWLRHRFSNNWSVAYPQNWDLYDSSEANLASRDEGMLVGWYGSGAAVSRHRYAIILSTPEMSNWPPSVSISLQNWIDAETATLSSKERTEIKAISQGRRKGRRDKKTVEFDSTMLLNFPDKQRFQFYGEPLPNAPVHQAYVWEFDELPPRIVTIKQLDPGFEPEIMQELLLTFVNRIYE